MDSATIKTWALIAVDLLLLFPLMYKRRGLRVSRANWCLLSIYLLIVVHYALVGYSITASTNSILTFGAALFLLCVIISNSIGTDRALHALSLLLMALSFVFIVGNFAALIAQGRAAFQEGNFTGLTDNANMLGGYLSILCIPPLLQGTDARRPLARMSVFMLLSLALFLIMLTRSRAAFFTLFAIILYFIVSRDNMRKAQKTVALIVTCLLVVAALIWIGSKYQDTEMFSTRTVLLLQRVEAIGERPWVGWGFNSDVFSDQNPQVLFPAMEKGNTVLAILEEQGIPLGTLLILAIGIQLWRTVRVLSKKAERRMFAGIVVGSSVHLSFETWMFNFFSVLSILFWMCVLLANGEPVPPPPPLRRSAATMPSIQSPEAEA